VPRLEGLATHRALDEPEAEVVRLEVLAHVARVEGDLAAKEARPGSLFRDGGVLPKECLKI
jgi:hypothetical protein